MPQTNVMAKVLPKKENDMDIVKAKAVLSKAVTMLMLDENAMLEQDNIDPAEESFDAYLSDLVSGMIDEYNISEGTAWKILNSFLDDAISSGMVSDMPDDDPDQLTGWVTFAKQIGMPGKLREWITANVSFE